MRNLGRHLRSRTFLRYFGSYAAVLFIVFAGISIYMFRYYEGALEASFIESELNLIRQIQYSNELSLNSMHNTAEHLGISELVAPFAFLDAPQRARPLMRLLASYRNINTFIGDIILSFHDDKFLFSGNTSIEVERFFSQGLLFETVSGYEFKDLLSNAYSMSILPSQNIYGLIIPSARMVVTFILPIGAGRGGSLIFLVDARQYEMMLRRYTHEIYNTFILHKGNVIVKQTVSNMPDSFVEEALAGGAVSGDRFAFGEETYMLITVDGEHHMTYATLIPMSLVTDISNVLQQGIWLFILGLIITSLIMTGFFAFSNYRPVAALRKHFDAEESRNDFLAIESGINNLFGQNLTLGTMLEEMTGYENYNIVLQFIKGRYLDRAEFLADAKKTKIDFDKQYYAIAVSDSGGGSGNMGKLSIETIEADEVTCCSVELISQYQKLYLLFSDNSSGIYEYLRSIHEENRSHNIRGVMAASAIYKDIKHGSTAFLEASAAFDNRFIVSNENIILFDEIHAPSNGFAYPEVLVNRLKSALRNTNLEVVDNVINEIFNHVKVLKPPFFIFRIFYNDIIRIALFEWGAKRDSLDAMKLCDVFTLSGCLSIEELSEMLREVCHTLFENTPQKDNTKIDSMSLLIEEARLFMQDNYDNPDVNISFIADRLSINTAAFTKEFKKYTNTTPLEYLTQLRIDQAAKLLSTTGINVKDVSVKVGYLDVSAFIKKFRIHMGMTPAMYRKTYIEVKND